MRSKLCLLLGLIGARLVAGPCPPGLISSINGCGYPAKTLRILETNRVLYLSAPEPLNREKIHLGRLLFFDPLLSGNHQLSCAHCHDPRRSFTDGLPVGRGMTTLTRATPPLWNVAFFRKFFWDGRAPTLEKQAEGPLFQPQEMGNTPERLLTELNQNAEYRRLFSRAFGEPGPIRLAQVTRALADFERTLVSLNSRYDHYVAGDSSAFSPAEERGLTLFRSFVTRCTECHEPPLFTNFERAHIGAPELPGLPADGVVTALLPRVFQKRSTEEAFRIPSLRNIARTAPYMHSGALASLPDVLRFYNDGGGRGRVSAIHWHIRRMGLSETEIGDIVSFLGTLTDESALPEIPRQVPSGLTPLTMEAS